MNPSFWSSGMFSSSSICLDGFTADPRLSGVSVSSHKDSEDVKMPPESVYYSSVDPGTTRRRLPSPASSSGGHQAKRARVENIIKGMTSSEVMTNQESDGVEGIQDEENRRKQLESQQQNLRQLRTSFNHVDGVTCKDEKYPVWSDSAETSPKDTFTDPNGELEGRKYQGWKKVKLMNYFQSKPERIKLMADVLKYELSRAVSRSVDSIFRSMPQLQESPNQGKTETDAASQSSLGKDNEFRLSCCGNPEVPDVQTEALSLVVEKTPLENKFVLQSRSRAQHHQLSERNHGAARRCLHDRCSEVSRAKFETFDAHWSSVKVRSKVNSRSVRSPQTRSVSVDPVLLENLCLPHVKIESDCLVKNSLYLLNEGLTTNHLKKAKLMFFYTRYPSSLVLKSCFHDVQFTRCITSQLIKWFSNFREFFYIQMEKFARHALMEGESDVRVLTVGRESELFRVLNVHFNKANDFQVPDRFLEVAEITLREFYVSISMDRDRDPSWKKAIYKVICKLDSDVPAEFKGHRSA